MSQKFTINLTDEAMQIVVGKFTAEQNEEFVAAGTRKRNTMISEALHAALGVEAPMTAAARRAAARKLEELGLNSVEDFLALKAQLTEDDTDDADDAEDAEDTDGDDTDDTDGEDEEKDDAEIVSDEHTESASDETPMALEEIPAPEQPAEQPVQQEQQPTQPTTWGNWAGHPGQQQV